METELNKIGKTVITDLTEQETEHFFMNSWYDSEENSVFIQLGFIIFCLELKDFYNFCNFINKTKKEIKK